MTLSYWGEPDLLYAPYDVLEWDHDPNVILCDKPQGIGYIPVYESWEEAASKHPQATIIEIRVMREEVQ